MTVVLILLCVSAGLAAIWRGRFGRSRGSDYLADRLEVDRLTWAWRSACEGAGVARVVQTVTGPTVSTPTVVSVVLGPPTVLVVRLLPGQVLADLRKAGNRMAPHLGAVALRWDRRGHEHARVELLTADPLTDPLPLVDADPSGPILLGRDEQGDEVREPLERLPHVAVQGSTRTGKSSWLYAVLGQVADRARTAGDVVIAGVDPSGLLLRPFRDSVHERWQVCGLPNLARIEELLSWLVDDMDRRIAAIPADRDTAITGPDNPLVLLVLEEWPGTLRALDTDDAKRGKRVRALTARLLSESHKAGYRIVLVAQRAEATLLGGNERAQCETRLSFRVDTHDAVKLLHPDADLSISEAHTRADPGVALLSMPGRPLSRVRAPWAGGYAAYVERVAR